MTDLPHDGWDVIVIGTGVGGGVIGRRLAEGGAKVLLLEKGPAGFRKEQTQLSHDIFVPEARIARGFWPKPMQSTLDGRTTEFYGPIGAGVGGSSAFYAATLERPEPHDLDDGDIPHPTGGWPVSYETYKPYFEEAEAWFHVSGTNDPLTDHPSSALAAPSPISPSEKSIINTLRDNGLNPYQAHLAVKNVANCQNCLGFKCPKTCKMDGRSAGVEPALAAGAHLLDICDVTSIKTDSNGVASIHANRQGEPLEFTAKTYVLAGGALASPKLLMASGNIANSSDQVGRNLMFHLNEMFAIWPKSKGDKPTKGIGLRDLYRDGNTRLGMVQAMGIAAKYGEIVHYLNMAFDRSRFSRLKALRQFTRIPAAIAHRLFGQAEIFTGLLEDMPYADNRVTLHRDDTDILAFTYNISPELRQRRKLFRQNIRKSFKGLRPVFLGVQPEINYGHPCGTLRFGNDPKTSVLDANCRSHDLQNLYVADASFMPTSFGANPSLMIAANAMRVGDHILENLKKGRADG